MERGAAVVKVNGCERCGQDRGVEGVTTVQIERTQDGKLEWIHVRECRECATKQAQEETQ